MKNHAPNEVPNARSVSQYVASVLRQRLWLTAFACVLAMGLTYVFYRPGPVSAWTGRTIVTIGIAPTADYLLMDSGAPLAPIETGRDLVARISDPIFRIQVLKGAKFEAATAAFSKELAASSLRAVVLENARDVSVEVSAGSRADVTAVFASLNEAISKAHEAIAERRLDIARSNIKDTESRIALIEKSSADLGQGMLSATEGKDGKDRVGSVVLAPNLLGTAETWNRLKDRSRRTAILLKLSEKTVAYVEPGIYPVSQRTIEPARTALLAGLLMLSAMIVLAIITAPKRKIPD